MKISIDPIKKPRIEMLPLIDIVFLLLVFFIYAMLSMAVHRALPVALPASETAEIDTAQKIAVTITHDGYVFANNQQISLTDLTAILQDMPEDERTRGVQVFADRRVEYQHLFQVLDKIKKAGISSISLQAEKDGGS